MKSSKKFIKLALPGEKLAVIEEFEGGEGTYIHNGSIRSITIGIPSYNLRSRKVEVKSKQRARIPNSGDTIIGQVESIQNNIINVRIHYLNNEINDGGFTGLLIIKTIKAGKDKQNLPMPCKLGDLIRARVVNNNNGIIYLSIDRAEDGVIFATCSVCGGKMVKIGNNIKCVECGIIERRKLAIDFSKFSL
ncbi:MAG: exosome complex RNA-binding protein Csl4 [Nitrososphaerales archaeon]